MSNLTDYHPFLISTTDQFEESIMDPSFTLTDSFSSSNASNQRLLTKMIADMSSTEIKSCIDQLHSFVVAVERNVKNTKIKKTIH